MKQVDFYFGPGSRNSYIAATQFRVLFRAESIADQESAILLKATANGVFGVAAFIVDGEVFWGQDRIPLLIHHLRNNR